MKKCLVLVIFLLVSCTHKLREVRESNEQKSCQVLLNELPQYKKQNMVQKLGNVSKAGVHYLAVGTGAIADVMVIFSAGIAVGLTVCSPALMADSYTGGTSNMAGACIKAFLSESNMPDLYDFPITTYIDGKTYKLTCPDLAVFEDKLRQALRCRDGSLSAKEIEWQVKKILSDKKLK